MDFHEDNNQINLPPVGITSFEDVKQMQNILSAFDNFEENSGHNYTSSQPERRQVNNSHIAAQPHSRKTNNLMEAHYDPSFDFGGEDFSSEEMPYVAPEHQQEGYYEEYDEPVYSVSKPVAKVDISFIKNEDAKSAVKKYLTRRMEIHSAPIQEIIFLDEKLNALVKDAAEIKQRYKRCKELNLTEAGDVFFKNYKITGAEIKIIELKLKNLNKSINQF